MSNKAAIQVLNVNKNDQVSVSKEIAYPKLNAKAEDKDINVTVKTTESDTIEIKDKYPQHEITAKDWVIGIMLMLFSAILFSFNGVLIKYASDIGYKSMEIFVFRSAMQLFITILATLFTYNESSLIKISLTLDKFKAFKTIEKPLIKWIILRGVFAGIAGVCYFHAITIIPLGDAITVFSIYPVVAAFVAWIVLKEKISIVHGFALCSAIVGVYLIANGTESGSKSSIVVNQSESKHGQVSWFSLYFGYIVSVIAALTGGLVFVFIRLATKRTLPIILVYSHGFWCFVLSFLVGIIFQGFTWNTDRTRDTILIIVGFGFVGYFGQWTMNKSTQLIPAAVSSLVRSSDSVFSYIWEVVIFSTIPTTETIIGAICVIIGIFLVSVEKLRHAYKKHKSTVSDNDGDRENEILNNKRIMMTQYGSTDINSDAGSTKIVETKKFNIDYAFGSNLSLDPNDSQICLMARK